MPGLGRSPGEGRGKSLQYSCIENPMHKRNLVAIVHRAAKRQTRINDQRMEELSVTRHCMGRIEAAGC